MLRVFHQSISSLMQLPVMPAAERHSELIADFQTNRARLSKSKMMGIGRLSSAGEARLRCHKSQMGLIPNPFGCANGQNALVDLGREGIGGGRP